MSISLQAAGDKYPISSLILNPAFLNSPFHSPLSNKLKCTCFFLIQALYELPISKLPAKFSSHGLSKGDFCKKTGATPQVQNRLFKWQIFLPQPGFLSSDQRQK